ncbi:hypothetical protein KIL84_012663 [Mauremys mutica]|uniref:Uncharacterized protein n=1 Tax=Mauremys mutica TaxID=74926 RepID=A0A9D4B1K7_9SAUR|nr:hypothetical protein KIL84_012663 [Mauremys mutica]
MEKTELGSSPAPLMVPGCEAGEDVPGASRVPSEPRGGEHTDAPVQERVNESCCLPAPRAAGFRLGLCCVPRRGNGPHRPGNEPGISAEKGKTKAWIGNS